MSGTFNGFSTDNIETLSEQFLDGSGLKLDIFSIFNKPLEIIMNSDIISNIFDITYSIGILLMLIYFLVDLEELAVRRQFTAEHFVRNFTKFVIGISVVSNIGTLLVAFDSFAQALVTDLFGSEGDVASVALAPSFTAAKNLLQHQSMFESAPSYGLETGAFIFVSSFASGILVFIIWGVAIKRAIDLSVYYLLAPIIFADLFTNGVYTVVARAKRALAIYLQLPFVYIAAVLGHQILTITLGAANVNSMQSSMSLILYTILILFGITKTIAHSRSELDRMFSA